MSQSLGASHVAFVVDDIEAKKAELEAKGIQFFSDVNVVDEGVLAGWRWVYFADPDGYPLELVEVAYYNATSGARGSRRISQRGRSNLRPRGSRRACARRFQLRASAGGEQQARGRR